jgi:uncharacterized protein YbcI
MTDTRTDFPMRPSRVAGGELFEEISRSLVQLYKEHFGKGPTKARTYMADDLVVCVLEGGFWKGEQTLRDHGRGDAVAESRHAFQESLRTLFVATIEGLVERRVVGFLSAVDPDAEMSAEMFVLAPAEPDSRSRSRLLRRQ